ncbi:MAG: DNA polymerase/3'-5' exonuclease PolX [Vulcanimicrobiaceae bacterium]
MAAPSNAEIARKLKDIRTLMEFAGEPFYKFMAYERAAETLENAGPVPELIASGELTKLPGIGKTIAGRIGEIVASGTSPYYEELAGLYPPSLMEVLGVSGIGMKTAQALYKELGIASLAALERALDEGLLTGMARLGPKSIENIKRGVLAYKGRRRRTPLGRALPLARAIGDYVAAGSPAQNVTYAGSVRRAEATVGDIDLICTSADPEAVIKRFTRWERAAAVLAEGSTKASIWLEDGLQVDLRVLPEDVYGNLLQHFTGSREHNIQLRESAVRKGLRVSENGILNVTTGDNLTCRTELEVYAALGLAYIPPEMRLGLGEIEAAADGTLPEPVSLDDLRGDFHMHCTWSDGKDTLDAMIAAAKARGYAYHSISDHSWGRGRWGLDPATLREQRAKVRALGDKYGIRTLCSAEVDILPDGSLDYAPEVLAELDLVVASVHGALNLSRAEMTERLVRACGNRYVNIIGHPTGRQVGAFDGYEFDYDVVFAAAARTGTALEIDGQPGRLDLPSALARRAREFGVTFSLDSDAHAAAQLEHVEYAVGQARRAWIRRDEVLNARSLEDVLEFVARKRKAHD